MPLEQLNGKMIDGLEFCAKVYSIFEQIRKSPDGIERLRMRTSVVEKKLLEELMPICSYIQAKYRAGRYISVCWVDGSQQFDAEIVKVGAYVESCGLPESGFLEVTCVMHPNEYLIRELINTKGFAFGLEGIERKNKSREIESTPISYTNREFIPIFSHLVIKQLEKKNAINYPPETVLIVQCTLNNIYFSDEWDTLIMEIRSHKIAHQFKEIFLFDEASNRFSTL